MAGGTTVKLSTIFGVIGAIGALLVIGGYFFSFGERIGRIEVSIASLKANQTKVIVSVGSAKDKASSDVLELAENARVRLREHEKIMGSLSETLVALTTEVRIRDGERGVMSKRIPVRVQETAAASKVDSKLKAVRLSPMSGDPLVGLSL
ncbi:MAG: hypothetical protein JRG69_01820 [Deltaproteobacteria bacterium]|nr:hypothetical protein [Deltaproteobacteria bacterium]